MTANGEAAPLGGHSPSASASAALHLFLQVNHAAVTRSGGPAPNADLLNLVGEFDLPTDHWVLVKSPVGTVVYEHNGLADSRDFQVAIARAIKPSGWAVDGVSRCS